MLSGSQGKLAVPLSRGPGHVMTLTMAARADRGLSYGVLRRGEGMPAVEFPPPPSVPGL